MEVESGNVSNYDLPSVGILLPAYVKKKIVSEVLKYTIEKQFFFQSTMFIGVLIIFHWLVCVIEKDCGEVPCSEVD